MKTPRLRQRLSELCRRLPAVIDNVARCLRDGGRLIYVGAGSSGRIAALDASEIPPTYSTLPQTVQYIMAGGPKALASSMEANEDSRELGQRDIARRRPTRKDIVIGISASGRTPYVVAALEYARGRGSKTAAVTCNYNSELTTVADVTIVAEVGPEVVLGSTRMKAGIRAENDPEHDYHRRHDPPWLCVRKPDGERAHEELQAGRARTSHSEAGLQRGPGNGHSHHEGRGKSVPIAMVMLKAGVDKQEAVRRLAKSDGNVRRAIEDTTLEL